MLGTHRIIDKVIFSLQGTGNSVQFFPLVKSVDSSDWSGGAVLIRFHSGSIAAPAQVVIVVESVSYAEDDPSLVFLALDGGIINVGIGSTVTPGTLLAFTLVDNPIGAEVRVVLQYNNNNAVAASTFGISVDLIGTRRLW